MASQPLIRMIISDSFWGGHWKWAVFLFKCPATGVLMGCSSGERKRRSALAANPPSWDDYNNVPLPVAIAKADHGLFASDDTGSCQKCNRTSRVSYKCQCQYQGHTACAYEYTYTYINSTCVPILRTRLEGTSEKAGVVGNSRLPKETDCQLRQIGGSVRLRLLSIPAPPRLSPPSAAG